MAQSIQQQHIDEEITALKQLIQSTEKDIQEINAAINDAEKHILADDNVSFWDPKLSSLRQDKMFLHKKEEKLQEEALVLEKSRLASLNIEAQSSEFGFFDLERDDNGLETDPTERRGRNTTWAGDHIALLADKRQGNSTKNQDVDNVKKVESSPSILTKVEEDDIVNHDPNANLQGQNRRPHMGNLKSKTMERENSFNVFGVGIEEEDTDVAANNSALKLPSKVTRDVSNSSEASSDNQSDKPYSVGSFLNEFFVASETLLLAQGNQDTAGSSSRSTSTDKVAGDSVKGSVLLNKGEGMQPAVSTHDFSVFGAEMYNDNDDENS